MRWNQVDGIRIHSRAIVNSSHMVMLRGSGRSVVARNLMLGGGRAIVMLGVRRVNASCWNMCLEG